jgi:hypothetical protein
MNEAEGVRERGAKGTDSRRWNGDNFTMYSFHFVVSITNLAGHVERMRQRK